MLTAFLIRTAIVLASIGHALQSKKARNALPDAGPPPETRAEAVRRVLKHLQRKTIAEMGEGEAAVIIGTVVGESTLTSPFTGAPCVGYHLRIRANLFEQFLQYRQLHDEARCASFVVRDATGWIAVDAQGLELAITGTTGVLVDPPHPRPIMMRVPPFSHLPVIVDEGVLMPGMDVLVCGVVSRDQLAASDYRNGTSQLILRASATFPLVASTDDDLFVEALRPIAPEELHRR